MGALRSQPFSFVVPISDPCPWQRVGSLTATQATFAVGDRDWTTVNAVTDAKSINWELNNNTITDCEFRFETTANADAHVVEIWVSAGDYVGNGDLDSYVLGTTLTLTGGQETGAGGTGVFVDTISKADVTFSGSSVIDSGNDRQAIYRVNLKGYKYVMMIATTFEAATTLSCDARWYTGNSTGGLTDEELRSSDIAVTMTTPTKTSTVTKVDAWQIVTAATTVEGSAADFTDSYGDGIFNVEIAQIEAVAHAGGNGPMVQVSVDGRTWLDYQVLSLTAGTAGTTTTVGALTADANTVVDLTDATTADFDEQGRAWFIKDGTIANSEVVFTKSNATNAVTILDAVQVSHSTGVNVYDRVDQFSVVIVEPFQYAKLVAINTDSDCDIAFSTHAVKVTAK